MWWDFAVVDGLSTNSVTTVEWLESHFFLPKNRNRHAHLTVQFVQCATNTKGVILRFKMLLLDESTFIMQLTVPPFNTLSFIFYIRRRYWNRENFQLPVFNERFPDIWNTISIFLQNVSLSVCLCVTQILRPRMDGIAWNFIFSCILA